MKYRDFQDLRKIFFVIPITHFSMNFPSGVAITSIPTFPLKLYHRLLILYCHMETLSQKGNKLGIVLLFWTRSM